MAKYNIKLVGADEFKRALNRNPALIINESKKFIQRAIAKYKSGVMNNPWRIGMSGGGSPVLTGNLRDTHITKIDNFRGSISVNQELAPYGKHVHKTRPWLEYVFNQKQPEIEELEKDLADVIIKDLAK